MKTSSNYFVWTLDGSTQTLAVVNGQILTPEGERLPDQAAAEIMVEAGEHGDHGLVAVCKRHLGEDDMRRENDDDREEEDREEEVGDGEMDWIATYDESDEEGGTKEVLVSLRKDGHRWVIVEGYDDACGAVAELVSFPTREVAEDFAREWAKKRQEEFEHAEDEQEEDDEEEAYVNGFLVTGRTVRRRSGGVVHVAETHADAREWAEEHPHLLFRW
jgi:hypothetical protein